MDGLSSTMIALVLTCADDATIAPSPDDIDFRSLTSVNYSVALQDDASNDAAAQAATDTIEAASPRARFGAEGTWNLNLYGAYGREFSGQDTLRGGWVGVSYFLIDDLSMDFELGYMSFEQNGPDTWGVNFNLIFRWHFLSRENWSLYADGGAGLLKANDDVPADGTSFNFTPQLGVGASFSVGYDWRIFTGVRWHHISNGRQDDNNPGRDSYQFYAGLSIPF